MRAAIACIPDAYLELALAKDSWHWFVIFLAMIIYGMQAVNGDACMGPTNGVGAAVTQWQPGVVLPARFPQLWGHSAVPWTDANYLRQLTT